MLTKSSSRRLILVSGAPRSGTTPIGNTLALAPRTASLYEPFGPTGMTRIRSRFPMLLPGELLAEQLDAMIEDLKNLRLELRNQTRPDNSWNWRTRLLGSRTLHTLRLAKLKPWTNQIIWKDPHAVMLVNDVANRGIDCVVCARSALAHASSFKRLSWISKATEIYGRWSDRYGADTIVEKYFAVGKEDPVTSASLLWRMCYKPLILGKPNERVHIVSAQMLERDERATYCNLFSRINLPWSHKIDRSLKRRRASKSNPIPNSAQIHNWQRSVGAVNNYWRQLLSDEECALVRLISQDVQDELDRLTRIQWP